MRDFVISWYGFLNTLFSAVGGPLRAVIPGAGGSVVVAVLLGVLAATSPCQLSTNASAIAYLGHGVSTFGRRTGWLALAYVAGKVLVYSIAGVLAVLLGQGLTAALLSTGARTIRFEQRVTSWEPWLRRAAGIIFLLTGINDTILYWFL